MRQRLLGLRTGLRVSSFALGTGRLGTTRAGGVDPSEARRTLDLFADRGGTLIDTSSAYQQGGAETLVGEFLKGAGRDGFVIASKYGRSPHATPPAAIVGSHRKAMRADIEGSLTRLGTDHIDIYMPHFDDGATPVEEIMAGLDDLVRQGKVVHLGLSNFPAWRTASAAMLAQLRDLAPITVVQLEYGLLARSADREHLPLARARGMAVMGYSPLSGGALAQRLRDRDAGSGADDPIADAVRAVAEEIGCTPTAVALAWVSAANVIPILGPRDSHHLVDGLAAAELQLSDAQADLLDRVSRPVLGEPYDLLANMRRQLGLAALSDRDVL